MNDRSNMDNNVDVVGSDVLVECKKSVSGVSATNRLPVADTHLVYKIAFCILGVMFLIALCFGDLKANATEKSVYVDSTYMQEQFGSYPYYLIVTDGSGNYITLYSSAQICYNGSVFRAFCTNHYYGYKTMKVVDDYLVIDENGTSYDKWSSISVSFNSNGLSSAYKTIVYSSKDIYNIGTNNTGSPTVGTSVVYSVANNIGSKPIEEPTEPAPSITVDCKFTDENIVEKLETMNNSIELLSETVTQKLDLILTLLIIFMALKMFSPLANNYKRGLQKKEK